MYIFTGGLRNQLLQENIAPFFNELYYSIYSTLKDRENAPINIIPAAAESTIAVQFVKKTKLDGKFSSVQMFRI